MTAKVEKAMLYYKTYTSEVENPWVVFIHGAGGSSSIWFKQLRAFKERFNVLLVDLRGHGRSQEFLEKHLAEDYTFEDIARDVIEVLDDAKVPKAHFVGISLGTIVVRTIGELAPERVGSMIMGGAVVRLNFRHKFFVAMGHAFKRVIPFIYLYKFFAWVIMPRRNHSESRLLFIREAKRLARKEFLRWWKLTHEVNPLLRYFKEKELPIPTLYIMGGEDHMFLGPVQRLVKEHEHASLQVVEDCGHVVNVDRPESFNELAIRFLQGQSAQPQLALG